ncbi:MAG TPA: hypothetical protein VLD61_02320, partial [Methylomirabilota bacterium]|nr:hypothetical protein [Methylomirabilota bacterium]
MPAYVEFCRRYAADHGGFRPKLFTEVDVICRDPRSLAVTVALAWGSGSAEVAMGPRLAGQRQRGRCPPRRAPVSDRVRTVLGEVAR